MADIMELTNLGFKKHKAAEAYMVCNKDKNLAANFLFNEKAKLYDLQA
jgi:hypothetical protein